ncbi:MAG TPA: TIGR02186 family protein [Sphingobium sp.]|nr:TIGR02186 family protein [Sphingobium sp.]
MRRILTLLLLPLIPLLEGGATSPRLVPDVSQRTVDIQYSFKGAELLLFGAIVYPGGRTPKDPADVVVVLKGPERQISIREKQKIAGIWVNADSMRFQSAPSFYAIASSHPINRITDERTAAIYELSIGNIQLSPTSFSDSAEITRFVRGLIDLQERQGLFVQRAGTVEITDGVLYRARLPLPARAVVGDYTAETFLIQDGRVVAAAIRDIQVRKSGFERFIAAAAEEWSFLYGLAATSIAVLMGLLAGWIGRRV